METKHPGWLTASEATSRYGITYNLLRQLVHKGVFTRGQFGSGVVRPPMFLRIDELDAWKRGGVGAVAPVKAAYESQISAPRS